MAKRRLTKQQKNRIKHRQNKVSERWASDSTDSSKDKKDLSPNAITAEHAHSESPDTLEGSEAVGLIVAHYGTQFGVLIQDSQELRCHKLATVPDLVAGDKVVWKEESAELGVIVGLLPRTTELKRVDNHNKLKLVAANIDRSFIVFAPQPEPSNWLIDCYLVAAKAANIEPIIVMNKSDLADATDDNIAHRYFSLYQSLGFHCIRSSTKVDGGLNEIQQALKANAAIFVGQSGVGKSSLINTLLGGNEAKIGDLSQQTGLGMHTTVMAQLYQIPSGGHLIDSPGIREFNFSTLTFDDITAGFPEIAEHLGSCKFRNCAHAHEPGCRFKSLIEQGVIEGGRFDSYQKMVQKYSV